MLFILIAFGLVGGGVLATTPIKPPIKCPLPTGPYKPPKCGENQYFEPCSKRCPPQNCSSLYSKYACKEERCRPECRCQDGFLRDDKTGKCITIDECLFPCGPSEHFVKNCNQCQRTCANYKVTGPQSLCKPFTGCVCDKGKVRQNDDGTGPCILPKQCPSRKCPKNEHWADCPQICLKESCISKSPDYSCQLPAIPLPCKPRCVCDKGYLRDSFGNCIPENCCPAIKECPANEVYRCTSLCTRDSCARQDPDFQCPIGDLSVCIPACACKDGFLRNDEGICVPRKSCPKKNRCGINEVAVKCAAAHQTCESIYTLYKPLPNTPCTPGCNCRPGYLRNQFNICIPTWCCPTVPQNQCGPNQEYKKCGTACEPSCSDLDNPNLICKEQCIAGCFCKEGYVKDDHGNCVKRKDCPLPVCNKQNEVAKACGSGCEVKTCDNLNNTGIVCPAVCIRGCFCRDGYVRNPYNVCVLPAECPQNPVCFQENEVYQLCGSSCPDNCDNYKNTDRICTANCVSACNCKPGFVRNLVDKTCVKPAQCPIKKCTGRNEELNYCGSYCPVTCANRLNNGDWACAAVCRVGCDCIPGTLRNDSGVCVPVEECTPPVCRQNEIYEKCGTACPLTCANYRNLPKICTKQCVSDCFCAKGYVRDRHMRCVKPEECEPICPAGEKFNECSAHCQDTCENYDQPNRICTYQCQSGCVCEEGTVRRKDGKCVPPLECKPQPTCSDTEIHSPCSAHCEPTCENSSSNQPCSRICKPGCKCKDGLVRRKDGLCVKLGECSPEIICSGDEDYDPCSAHCEDTCESHGPGRACTAICKPGCRCGKGLVRRKDGKCVKLKDCTPPPVCRQNEIYQECGTACPLTCANYKNPPKICTLQCVSDCFCAKGYVRDRNMRCVKPEECAPEIICSADEDYDPCSAHCEDTCESHGPGRACTKICKPGCRCGKGLVRRKDGKCVKLKDCTPPPVCRQNEIYQECGTACPLTCANYKNPPKICTLQCVSDCFCAKGYVRDRNMRCVKPEECAPEIICSGDEDYDPCSAHCEDTCESHGPGRACTKICKPGCRCGKGLVRRKDGKCVKLKDCTPPPVCRQNEIYQECGTACPLTCANYKNPPKICTLQCVSDCFCAKGYVRDRNMRCVKPEECAPEIICSADEDYDPCSAHCEDTCESHGPGRACTKICKPGCRCGKGLVRRKDGKCVKLKDCTPPPVCRQNEIYQECGTACPLTCANYKNPPKICTLQCVSDCFCAKGYVRDRNMRCVKPEECAPEIICSGDEDYDPCSAHCEDTCESHGPGRACTKICKPGCRCGKGLVRRKDGKCVKLKDCTPPPVCRQNEIYQECGTACPLTCANYKNPPKICTLQCVSDCFCAKGYVRDRNMRCVKPEECAPEIICSADEDYDPCSAHCEDTCESHGPGRACTKICKPGCRCGKGLVRRKDGKCVKLKDCTPPPVCRENEIYQECGTACPLTCANYKNPPKICTKQCLSDCFCAKGYVRDRNQKCVKPEKCAIQPSCPALEEYDKCSAHCEPTCENNNPNRPCTDICKPGCKCGPGLVRRNDGKCVKIEECRLEPSCPPLEHYDDCNAHCEPTCESYGNTVACLPYCTQGCACNKGLVRRDDGKCVKVEECKNPPICPDKEYHVSCVIGTCSPKTCAEQGYPIACPDIIGPCKGGCICIEDYLRDKNGKCIPKTDCPSCRGDYNATGGCGNNCGNLCSNYDKPNNCSSLPLYCEYNGCDCKKGYVFDSVSEKCLAPKDCPIPCNGDIYAESKDCPNPCPATCAKPNTKICNKACLKKGCQCRPGYILGPDGKCTKPENCPDNLGCNGDMNAIVRTCPNSCQPTCQNQGPVPCPPICLAPGCECKYGYILSKPGGKCIPIDQCNNSTCLDPKAIKRDCGPNEACRPTCAQRIPGPCPKNCVVNGCECPPGLILSEKGGRCIKIEDCPPNNNGTNCSDLNALRVKCAPNEACKPTCAQPNPGPCPKNCVVNGCECPPGFVLLEKGGKCIRIEYCPLSNTTYCNNDPNAHIKVKPLACPSTCDSPEAAPHCKKLGPAVGCECKPGYILSKDGGSCILPDKCPGGNPCGSNANFAHCKLNCPYHNCPVDDNRGIVACDPPSPCPSGCVCKHNYLFKDGKCILASHCPPINCTRQYEEYSPCGSDCLRESCADINNQPTTCNTLVFNCRPQCICKKGHFRNDQDLCVPAKECPINQPCSDRNAKRVECASECQPTCAKPEPGPCILRCKLNGCVCKKGFILSAAGTCIPVDECPKDATCNGDSNAVIKVNPLPCPSTCSQPNSAPNCKKYTPEVGCVCKPGYIKSNDDFDAKCIEPNTCPGGNPCGKNATLVYCNVNCPTDRCLVSDTRAIIACSPPYPCPSGCACKPNYRRRSSSNPQCISVFDCPAVNCTGPNEMYSPCTSNCLAEDCKDKNQTTTCISREGSCRQRCICKKGHYRNENGTCVPADQCPNQKSCSDPNAEWVGCPPAPKCRPTCAVPNPGPCIQYCDINKCVCKKGFILSAAGKCIPVDQCPKDALCNGDSNAVIKANPIPCPSTCASPNASPYCKRYAPPVGCECKPGFIKSTDDYNGKCIKPNTCPGGNPCGPNATFVPCNVNCPTNACLESDTRAIIACSQPYPCPSGCACKLNYRRNRAGNNQCILTTDCPRINCTRQNEVYTSCSSPCLAEYCTDINKQPSTCNTLVLNCQQKCICKKGYFRNKDDICVPAYQCPNQSCKDLNAVKVKCAPAASCQATCAVPNPEPCTLSCVLNGCVCKKGYILSKKGGKCVPISQCPTQPPCNGDVNAIIKAYPRPCPSTCSAPNEIPCRKASQPVGCVCKDGYILSENGGKCILPDKCPGGNPCGRNETYVNCKVTCSGDYCPVNNSSNTAVCEVPNPCYSGCICKINYRRTSVQKPGCQLASECPPLKCGKNQKWSGCPSACLAEECKNANDRPVTCNTLLLNCQPKCICKKGYFRDSNRQCIPADQCPKPIKCKKNEVYKPCSIICPPQTCASSYTSYDCSKVNTKCKPGCDCISGYVRNGTATDPCIPSEQCPPPTPVCGANEHYEVNRNKSDLTCKTKDQKTQISPCKPTSGCFCDDGFVRNNTGICVKPGQCPKPIICPANEMLRKCYNSCQRTCKTRIRCDSRVCHISCTKNHCVCKPDYLRHDNGTCVPISHCSPPQCNENETYSSCGTACPPTCQNRGDNCTVCTKQCVEGCFCNKGLVRADDGTCVKPKNCPRCTCKDSDKIFIECPSSCPVTDGCSLLWSKFNCTGAVKCCKPSCRCKPGLYRGPSGACITAKECINSSSSANQSCSDLNAVWVKCAPASSCQATCAVPNPRPCISSCALNGCVCKKGYILSKKGGKCVPISQCPKQPTCNGDGNAIIKAYPLPCPSTCSAPNAGPCKKPSQPVGCVCKTGYILSENGGKCILPDKCPGGNPCGSNETYTTCKVNYCLRDYCPVSNNPNTGICEVIYPCYSGCVCKFNYRRTSVKKPKCQLASECPPVKCGKNEKWTGCASTCLNEKCENANNRPVTCDSLECQPKCICKKGYFRDRNGHCVLANQCPKPIKCKKNEVYKLCSINCPPQTCAAPYTDYDCSKVKNKCIPGCDCISGYVRNGTATDPCIPSEQCPGPKPVCGANEHYEVNRNKCDLTCKTKDQKAQIGPCKPTSGCFCDDGFVRNKTGICVKPGQCPKPIICPINEVLSNCYNSCQKTCKTRIRGDGRVCHTACIETGCVCKTDYLRHDNGTCVPISHCSPPQCNKNEIYNKCGTACPPTCQNRGDNCTICTKKCVEDCFCIKGFVRADNGSCVKPIDCPKPVCGANEHYEDNRNKCDLTCKTKDQKAQIGPCKPTSGCFCNDGFVRNKTGICVKPGQCPKPIICPTNEVLTNCYNSCQKTCKTRIRGDGRVCHTACIETGCVCKTDYLRHDNGTCVPISHCSPPQCNKNEIYNKCGTACPPTCQNRGDNCTICTKKCVEDCFCIKGFVRADNGSCVKPNDCPRRVCKYPGDFLDECPPTCPPTDGCSLLWSKFNCTGAVRCCKPNCRCKPGLYRGPSGTCITAEQCTNSGNTRANEAAASRLKLPVEPPPKE